MHWSLFCVAMAMIFCWYWLAAGLTTGRCCCRWLAVVLRPTPKRCFALHLCAEILCCLAHTHTRTRTHNRLSRTEHTAHNSKVLWVCSSRIGWLAPAVAHRTGSRHWILDLERTTITSRVAKIGTILKHKIWNVFDYRYGLKLQLSAESKKVSLSVLVM